MTNPATRAVGLALVEFIWQGAAVGVTAAALFAVLRRATPQARYLVACVALAMMAALPVMTATQSLWDARGARNVGAASPVPVTETARVNQLALSPDVAVSASHIAPFSRDWLEPRLSQVTALWGAGVLVFALQLMRGWLRLGRLRRSATPLANAGLSTSVMELAERVGVLRPVALVESALVDVPAVVGHLRPILFVPASALTGLTPAHLEAILAHELAHIRRADYLVNAAQCVVEVLLFYHPAVWWVSKQMRGERELCCDDLAVSACGDRLTYARALASLEELRSPTSTFVVAADGGELLARVRRLVGEGSRTGARRSGGTAMGVVMTVLLFAVGGGFGRGPADAKAMDAAPNVVGTPATMQPAPTSPPLAPAQKRPISPRALSAREGATAVVAVATPEENQAPTQSDRGSLAGVVMDPSGGVIPGATITVTPTGSTGARTAITSAAGRFRIDDLPVGSYDVRVRIIGFRETGATVPVTTNQVANMSVRLQIGGLMESVNVRRTSGTPPAAVGPTSSAGQTAQNLFDAARVLGEQGHIAEAEEMAARALAALRSGMPQTGTVSVAPPAPAPPTGIGAAGAQGPAVPIRVGGDIRAPRKIRDVKPTYPPDAGQAEGVVLIEATIAKDGSVQNARVLRGVPGLDDAALTAVRQWMYTPTLLNGMAVEVVITVTVTFGK